MSHHWNKQHILLIETNICDCKPIARWWQGCSRQDCKIVGRFKDQLILSFLQRNISFHVTQFNSGGRGWKKGPSLISTNLCCFFSQNCRDWTSVIRTDKHMWLYLPNTWFPDALCLDWLACNNLTCDWGWRWNIAISVRDTIIDKRRRQQWLWRPI